MAAKAEVSIRGKLSGSVTGVSVTYQVGSVPYATIDLISSGGSSMFSTLESSKRSEYSVDISCIVHAGQASEARSLRFEGLLDGMSLASSVGRSHFQAVLKGKAQALLELTTLTPGLYPSSINIYTMPAYSISSSPENGMVESWGIFDPKGELPYDSEPIVFYTELMKAVLKSQTGSYTDMLGVEPLLSGDKPYDAIFKDKRYKQAATQALKLLEGLDISAVTGGGAASAGTPSIFTSIQKMFMTGPNVLLENYMHFLAQMGCSMIFGNNKMWVVPMNTVVKPNGGSPTGGGKLQDKPNAAGPADCIAYSYNDVGYRDIACVIVQAEDLAGGVDIGSPGSSRDHLTHYAEPEGTSKASGVLVVKNHPWMAAFPMAGAPSDAKEPKQRLDQQESMYPDKQDFAAAARLSRGVAEEVAAKKKNVEELVSEVLENYAQTKFLQARYGDRQGSITLDFNPKWVPGTGGTLYLREIGTTLSFYVTSVTHHIDLSAPSSGTAITTVSFTCGRAGSGPVGTESDKFLGYNAGKEKGVQGSFLSDIGA